MALLYCESFDGVETIEQLIGAGGTRKLSITDAFVETAQDQLTLVEGGRTGRGIQGFNLRNGSVPGVFRGLGSTPARLISGMAIHIPTATGAPTTSDALFGFLQTGESSDVGSGVHVRVSDELRLQIQVGNATAATAPAETALDLDTWYYVEIDATIAASGAVVVRLNEVVVVEFAGDTRANSSGTVSFDRAAFWMANGWSSPGPIYDDWYVVDTTGAIANTFLGDQIVEMIRPNADGDLTEWVNSDGNSVNNFSFVNERDVDSARFVESTVNGNRDLYGHQNLPADFGALAGVQVTVQANHLSNDTPMNLALLSREGASEDQSGDITLTLDSRTHTHLFHDAPDAAQWTRDKVNAAQFGVRSVQVP